MKILNDISGIEVQKVLRAALLNHDAVVAKNNEGISNALPITQIKWELIPFLRYGLAKLNNIVSLSVNDNEVFFVRNGISYVNTDACNAYMAG